MERELDVRSEFPALLADPGVIFADAATGTQVLKNNRALISILSDG
jgi:hypothetical protein